MALDCSSTILQLLAWKASNFIGEWISLWVIPPWSLGNWLTQGWETCSKSATFCLNQKYYRTNNFILITKFVFHILFLKRSYLKQHKIKCLTEIILWNIEVFSKKEHNKIMKKLVKFKINKYFSFVYLSSTY